MHNVLVVVAIFAAGTSAGFAMGAVFTAGRRSDEDEAPEPKRRSKITLRGKGTRQPNAVLIRRTPVPPGERDERSQHPHPQSDSSPQRASGGNVPSFNVRGKNVIS
jgi:hypothetical protein